jgi:hypothetical protein
MIMLSGFFIVHNLFKNNISISKIFRIFVRLN